VQKTQPSGFSVSVTYFMRQGDQRFSIFSPYFLVGLLIEFSISFTILQGSVTSPTNEEIMKNPLTTIFKLFQKQTEGKEISSTINIPSGEDVNQISPLGLQANRSNIENSCLNETQREIKKIVEERDILFLCHFTHISNLHSILSHGLWSRNHLADNTFGNHTHINDYERLDGKLNSISVSISYPNYQMFYKYNKGNQEQWVILFINASVLWEQQCLFFPTNAASFTSTATSLDELQCPDAFRQMFCDFNNTKRELLNIPCSYTTNPQAEVMVKRHIPKEKIVSVVFRSQQALDTWKYTYRSPCNPKILVNQMFFSSREDYRFWKK